MKKLLVFRPTLGQGGADRVTAVLLDELSRRDFEITLVLIRGDGEFIQDIPEAVKICALGVRDLSSSLLPLTRLVAREQPDILFSTSSGGNSVAVLAHLLTGRGDGSCCQSEAF